MPSLHVPKTMIAKPAEVDYMPSALPQAIAEQAKCALSELRIISEDRPLTRTELAALISDPRFQGWFYSMKEEYRSPLAEAMAASTTTANSLTKAIAESINSFNNDTLFKIVFSPLCSLPIDNAKLLLEQTEFKTPTGNRYRLEKYLGHGGSGDVFQAREIYSRNQVVGPKIALKFESPVHAESTANQVKVTEELRLSAHHVRVPTIYDTETLQTSSGPIALLAMDFINGAPLGRYVQDIFPLQGNTQELLEHLLHTVRGYEELYRLGRVQEDQHPNNVMVSPGEFPTFIDFANIAKNQDLAITGAIEGFADVLLATKRYWLEAHPTQPKEELNVLVKIAEQIYSKGLSVGEVKDALQNVLFACREPEAIRTKRLSGLCEKWSTKAA